MLCCDVTYVVLCICVVLEATIGRLLQLSISHPRLVNCEPTRLAVTQRETRTTQASLDLTCEGEGGGKGEGRVMEGGCKGASLLVGQVVDQGGPGAHPCCAQSRPWSTWNPQKGLTPLSLVGYDL